MRKGMLVFILLIGFLLRVLWLDKYPAGFTPDEASQGYDAYSLLKTGKDQWGKSFPLTFRSFGDFKLPVYTYLTVPSVAIFDLNEFSTRLPSALVGTLAILTTYLMSAQLFGWQVGIVSAVLLAISPWHLPLSRGAFEANLTVFFASLGTWLFLKGLKNPALLVVSSLVFGINLFTYHSARLFTPLLGLSLLLIYKDELRVSLKNSKNHVLGAFLVFALFLSIAAVSMFSGAGARGSDIAIFNPTDKWSGLADERYGAVLAGAPDFIARIFSNKVIFTLREFTRSYLSYFSPQFLFTGGAGEWTYGMVAGHGVLYLVEIIFVISFLAGLAKGKWSNGTKLIVLWILLSIIPAALTKGPGYAANRAAVIMPALQIASAIGAATLLTWINKKYAVKFMAPLCILLAISTLAFLENYAFVSKKNMEKGMLAGRKELVEVAQQSKDKNVIMSKRLSEPHIYTAFYTKWDPADYQKESQDWLRYEKNGLKFVDQLGEYKLGRFTFKDINYQVDSQLPNTLLIPTNESK